MSRPNILFIQVDQMSADSLRAYGNPVVQTPTLDALAARGAVFDTACCNYPLCAPSRASMAAGRLASRIGAYDNAAEYPAEYPSYAHYLRGMGYHTAVSGKLHFIGPDQHHGFDQRLTPDLYPADFAWVPNWDEDEERDTNDARAVTVSGVCARSVQIDFDEGVTQAARQYLFDHAGGRHGDAPFFLQVSYTHPHEPYLCLREYWDLYEGEEIPLPRVQRIAPREQDDHSARVLADFGMLEARFTDDEIRRARRAHFGAISWIDRQISHVLGALDAAGLTEQTYVIFTADHGDYLGERGMWFKKHFHEPSLKVPLMVAGPGVRAQRVASPASLVDLLPTFCGLASGGGWQGAAEPLDGADLRDFMAGGRHHNAPRDVRAEYLAEATTAPILMIRRGPWKYIHCRTDAPLLYHLGEDPLERVNRAGDPAVAEIEAALAADIRAHWDEEALSRDIVLSQRRRRLIRAAVARGTPPRWNHGEAPGEAVKWYRGEGGYNEWAFDHLPAGDGG